MFITSIIGTAALGAAGLQSPTALSCPITLQPVVKGSTITDLERGQIHLLVRAPQATTIAPKGGRP